jgi:hypothetical protein
MDPLFSLPTTPAPIFGRTTNFEFKKVLPDSIFDTGRPAARHVFRWQNQAAEWWVPAQSYLRIRCSFLAVNADGSGLRPVVPADGIAPVMNLPPHMFNRIEYFMDGNKLSDLQDYVPEIDTMKTRMNKSKAWFRSVGARSAFWESDFGSRQARICPQFSTGAGGAHSLGDNVQTQTLSRKQVLCWQRYAFNLTGVRSAVAQDGAAGTHVAVYKEASNDLGATDRGLGVFTLGRAQNHSGSAADGFAERMTDIGLAGPGLSIGPLNPGYESTAFGEGIPSVASFRRTGVYNVGMQTVTGRWFPKLGAFFYDKKRLFNSRIPDETEIATRRSSEGGRVITTHDYAPGLGNAANPALAIDTQLIELVIRPLKEADTVEKATRHEICWKPPLGIFDVSHAIPTTRHELHLVIPTDYQTRCIDFGFQPPDGVYPASRILDPRRANAVNVNDNNKIFFRIDNIEFFAGMATGPRADDAKFVLDLREYRMFPQTIPTGQEGTSNTYVFNLSSNSASVSVAFQSSTAGNGSLSLSKFHIPTTFDEKGGETALKRFYVNFANQNRPREENESKILRAEGLNPLAEDTVDEGGTVSFTSANFFMQRYLESMLNTSQLYKAGGCETFEEWLQRGVFYNWVWPRDGSDLSTRFHVFVSFETTSAQEEGYTRLEEMSAASSSGVVPTRIRDTANLIRILVFDMVPRAYMLSIRNGAVVGAETSNVMVADGVRRLRTDVM